LEKNHSIINIQERGETTLYYKHLQEDAAQEDETEGDRYRFRSLQEQLVGGDMKIHGYKTPKSVDRKKILLLKNYVYQSTNFHIRIDG